MATTFGQKGGNHCEYLTLVMCCGLLEVSTRCTLLLSQSFNAADLMITEKMYILVMPSHKEAFLKKMPAMPLNLCLFS